MSRFLTSLRLFAVFITTLPLLRAANDTPIGFDPYNAQQREYIDYFEKRYQRPDGKFYPNYSSHFSKKGVLQYNEGFHDRLGNDLFSTPLDSAGTTTMRFREKAMKRSVEYRIGFSVAATLYFLHYIDQEHASAKPPDDRPGRTPLPSANDTPFTPANTSRDAEEKAWVDYFVKRYWHADGKFHPQPRSNPHPSKKEIQHDEGFNDGLSYALYWLPMDGSGSETKKSFEKANKRSEEYRIGFLVAWELFALHRIETRQAPAPLPGEVPDKTGPRA